MVGKKNLNSNLKSWTILTMAVTIPVIAALAGSYLLGSEAFKVQDNRGQQLQMEEVRAQSRLLLENVWDQIDSIKVKALAYSRTQRNLDPSIKSLTLMPPNSISQIAQNQIQETGSYIARVKNGNLLVISFAADPIISKFGASYVTVTVDPAEVFSRFGRWATRREAGNLRGYLISSDGHVLAHSERAFAGSDFSGSEVYQQALRPLFQNQRTGGVATYQSADLRNVLTAYVRLNNLPFAVVVERVVHPWAASIIRPVLIPAILLVGVAALLSLFSMLALRKYFADSFRSVIRVPALDPAMSIFAQAQEARSFKHQLQEKLSQSIDMDEDLNTDLPPMGVDPVGGSKNSKDVPPNV